jgi:hypothetical protein
MSEASRVATRYEAAKLYLIGKYAAQLVDLARVVTEVLTGDDDPSAPSAAASEAMYGPDFGCVKRLHHIGQLAAGVLPWEVVQGINTAYADLAEHVDPPDGAAMLADAARVLACVEWLESRILPDWDVRARV